MHIDDTSVEALLWQEESEVLDVKREQYKFINASDDEKSELLKDVLAFVNAWRHSDAFILTGVKEVKGARSEAVGISELLDDAALQQFVNSKTHRPVVFSYKNITFEGKKLGVVHIPVQERPLYLTKDFGRLRGQTVYVRRGSATDIASPDEISRMGIQPQLGRNNPQLEVFFADPRTRSRLPDTQAMNSLALTCLDQSSIPDYTEGNLGPFATVHSLFINHDYYRELVEYTQISRLVLPFYLAVANSGSLTANDVRLEIRIDQGAGEILVLDAYNYPEVPKQQRDISSLTKVPSAIANHDIQARTIGDQWLVEARTKKVQPRATHWVESPFYLGAIQTCRVPLKISIFSDDLSAPVDRELFVDITAEQRHVDLQDVLKLEGECLIRQRHKDE